MDRLLLLIAFIWLNIFLIHAGSANSKDNSILGKVFGDVEASHSITERDAADTTRKRKNSGKKFHTKKKHKDGKRKSRGNNGEKKRRRNSRRKMKANGKKERRGRKGRKGNNNKRRKGGMSKNNGKRGKGKGKQRKSNRKNGNKTKSKNKNKNKFRKGKGKGKNTRRSKQRKSNSKNRNKTGKGRRKTSRKKTKKNGSQKRKQSNCVRNTTGTISADCLEKAVFYMQQIATIVNNFEKQKTRMEKQNKTGGNKSGKKGLFKPLVDRITSIGGGNKSNLACGGQTGNSGATQLANLTSKFEECETKINESCNPSNFPKPNATKLNMCSSTTKSFAAMTQTCFKLKGEAACSCWTNSSLATMSTSVKGCSFKSEADAISSQLKKCKKAFSVCRKYEDDTIKAMSSCSKSVDKLKERAKNLADNKKAVDAAIAKIDTLTGSSGRSARQAKSCGEVVSKASVLMIMIKQNGASTKVKVISIEISSSDVTCSDAEKTALKESSNGLKKAVTVIATALEIMMQELQLMTGSKPSNSEIESYVPPGATTQSGGPAGATTGAGAAGGDKTTPPGGAGVTTGAGAGAGLSTPVSMTSGAGGPPPPSTAAAATTAAAGAPPAATTAGAGAPPATSAPPPPPPATATARVRRVRRNMETVV